MSELLGLSTQLQVTIPSPLETDWATSIRNNCFQKIVEHDHTGVSGKGIKLATAAISDDAITGAKIRLDNNEYLKARNAANSANKSILKVNASDEVEFGTTVGVIDLQDDGLTISDNSDNTKKIALNASNITTGTTRTLSAPDATGTIVLNDNTVVLTNKTIDADSNTITNIENADIKAGAAIAVDKLAAITASRAVASDASGFITASATTSTELGYVSGVTSAIQTQLNAKAPSASPTFSGTVTTPVTASRALVTGASNELAASTTTATEIGYVSGVTSAIQTQLNAKLPTTITTTGDIIYSSSGTTASRLAIGSAGEVLTVSGGLPSWAPVAVSPTASTSKAFADSPYTATTSDAHILVNTSGGAVTINLYSVASNDGRKLRITKTNSDLNVVTIDGDGAETINGSAQAYLIAQYEWIDLYCTGSEWLVLDRGPELVGYIYEKQTAGSNGGGSTANTVQTRDLAGASSSGDFTKFGSLSTSTDRFTLYPGKYVIKLKAVTYDAEGNQLFLYNQSDGTYDLTGLNIYNASADEQEHPAICEGVITLTSSKTFEVRHWTSGTKASTGLGFAQANGTNNPATEEYYGIYEFKKIG